MTLTQEKTWNSEINELSSKIVNFLKDKNGMDLFKKKFPNSITIFEKKPNSTNRLVVLKNAESVIQIIFYYPSELGLEYSPKRELVIQKSSNLKQEAFLKKAVLDFSCAFKEKKNLI